MDRAPEATAGETLSRRGFLRGAALAVAGGSTAFLCRVP